MRPSALDADGGGEGNGGGLEAPGRADVATRARLELAAMATALCAWGSRAAGSAGGRGTSGRVEWRVRGASRSFALKGAKEGEREARRWPRPDGHGRR